MTLPTTSNTTDARERGFDVRLDDHYFRLALTPQQVATVMSAEKQAPGVDVRENPEDVDTNRQDTRTFSRVDFSGGEGLDFAHRQEQVDEPRRFWSSYGVEVVEGHGETKHVRLTRDLEVLATIGTAVTEDALAPLVAYAGGSVFVANGTAVTRVDNPTGAATTVDETPGGTVNSITSMDGEVYAATSTGIKRRTAAGSWSAFNSLVASRLWAHKGRLVATDGPNIYEVADGTDVSGTPLVSLSDSEEFTCTADAGTCVLAGATNGYVYALANLDGQLILRQQTPFHGEEVTGLAVSQGVVQVATRESGPNGTKGRLYSGPMRATYSIEGAQLYREWDIDAGLKYAPGHVVFSRDDAYLTLSSGSSVEVWKYEVETAGLFQLHASAPGAAVYGTVVVDGYLFYVDEARRLVRQTDDYVTEGRIVGPMADFATAEDKVWAELQLLAKELPTNTWVELLYSTDPDALEDVYHASWTSAANLTAPDDDPQMISEQSRWLACQVVLRTSDVTATPQVRGYTQTAYAGPGQFSLELPVVASDLLERPGRATTVIPGLGQEIYAWLVAKEGRPVTAELLATGDTVRGSVVQVGTQLRTLTLRGSQTQAVLVRVRGRRA